MKLRIKPEVFERFNSDLRIAFILVKEMDNTSKVEESKHLLKEVEKMLRLTFHNKEIAGNVFIKPWDLAKLRFGKEAHHYHTSVEKLLKKVISGKDVSKRDTLTNILRFIALKYLIPYGIDDFHKIDGSLTFDVVKSGGRKGILGKLRRGDLYYYDSKSVLGAKVDYWKNKKTEVGKKSYASLVHLIALPPIDKSSLRKITKETVSLIEAFCGAKTEIFILDKRDLVVNV